MGGRFDAVASVAMDVDVATWLADVRTLVPSKALVSHALAVDGDFATIVLLTNKMACFEVAL